MSLREVNQKIYSKFYLGETGVTLGSIAYGFEVDGGTSAVAAGFTEDSNGWYEQTFIPDAVGIWTEKLTYGDFQFSFNWEVAGGAVSSIVANETVYGRIYVGTTGLVQANFINLLEVDNSPTSVSPTITEEGGGWYDLSFKPDVNGDWIFWVQYGDDNFILEAFVAEGSGAASNTNVSVALNQSSHVLTQSNTARSVWRTNNNRGVSLSPPRVVQVTSNNKGVTVR